MSDMRVWFNKTKKELSSKDYQISALQELINESSEQLLGLRIIASHYAPRLDPSNLIPLIAIDENNQIVLVEFRKGKYNKLIQKGLMQLDYVKEHLSEFKMLLLDAGFDSKMMVWIPRLLILGDDFNEYDGYAIRQLPYPIELIKVQFLEKEVVLFEKIYISRHLQDYQVNLPTDLHLQALLRETLQFLTSLGDEVVGLGLQNQYNFRKIKQFCRIEWDESLIIHFKIRNKLFSRTFRSVEELEKLSSLIEEAYDKG